MNREQLLFEEGLLTGAKRSAADPSADSGPIWQQAGNLDVEQLKLGNLFFQDHMQYITFMI